MILRISTPGIVKAVAPGKVILFGEHAVNRSQPALSAAVGLYCRCSLTASTVTGSAAADITFQSGERTNSVSWPEVMKLTRSVESWRSSENFDPIRELAKENFFAAQTYILGSALGESFAERWVLRWDSEVPPSSGLGSGGSAFVSLVAAVSACIAPAPTLEQRAAWAHLGDVVAHGGVASALDTQTSLLGGVVRFSGLELAQRVECAPGMMLLVVHSGVQGPTRVVNARVRQWLSEDPPGRLRYFHTVGALTRAAEPALAKGDWDEVGRLMLLNQLVLEKLGVSCPEVDHLIQVALREGAYGAKVSGSGGGGILIALVPPERRSLIEHALTVAGGVVWAPPLGVPGTQVTVQSPSPTSAN